MASVTSEQKYNLHLLYVKRDALGYGRYGIKLAEALAARGVGINEHLDPGLGTDEILNLACWVSTPSHATGWYRGQRTVISTMWEAIRLPEAFRDTMDSFDQVIVPSLHNQELFSKYHKNVTYVPLGVDTKQWQFVERTAPERNFVFMIGGSGARKGLDLAYKAFKKLWPTEGSWPRESPRPTLLFKSPAPIDYMGDRIKWVGGRIPAQEEIDLYAMAHCYLQPSRGEGWGLQPLQAIAQGCPTILTDAHGHKAFSHLGLRVKAGISKAEYFIYGDAGQWWEPDLDELCDQMKWVYDNYEPACVEAKMSSYYAHREFTWDKCATRFLDAIGRHHLLQPYKGDREWTEPERRRYLVRVRQPWQCQIAGRHLQLMPGQDYWETADVKRILFEQQAVLDPSCLEVQDDVGLAPEQFERIKDYSAAMSYCWTCHQQLNSGKLYEPEFEDDNVG